MNRNMMIYDAYRTHLEPSRLPVKPSAAPETVERGAQPGVCRQELEALDEEAEVGRTMQGTRRENVWESIDQHFNQQ